MIVVTGGAGFIGSHIVNDLAAAGLRVVVSDLLRSGEKWRHIKAAQLHDLVRPDALFDWLGRHRGKVAAIVHMAAISTTTEPDIDRYVASNIRLTLDLWQWCAANRRALHLRLFGGDLWRRQRRLCRRPEPGGARLAAPAQPLWLEQAPRRPPDDRRSWCAASRRRRNGPGSNSSMSMARTRAIKARCSRCSARFCRYSAPANR